MKKRFKYKSLLLAATLLMGVALAGCSEEENTADGKTEETHFNMGYIGEIPDLEPTKAWNGWLLARTGVGENLVQIDENMNFKEVIAESWEKVDDVTTTFKIREGVKFHNGKEVDANAVKASLERALAITDREDIKIPIESITADGYTLTIQTTGPFPMLINNLSDPVYIIVDAEAAKDEEAFKKVPIATGPFQVTELVNKYELQLKKNEQHWSGEIAVDTITFKGIPDESTRVMALQSGEVDFITQVTAKDLTLFENNDDYTVLKGPNLRIFQLDINREKPYMQNLGFRQALAHGLNKTMYAENLANGIPAKGPFSDVLSFGHKGQDTYEYNPEKANTLLDQEEFIDTDGNGIRELDGKDIILKYILNTGHGNVAKNVAVAIQDDYKNIGIGVEIVQMENITDLLKNGDFDLAWKRITSAPTADPAYFLESNYLLGSSGNDGNYSNPEIDAIVEELKITFDKEQRDALGLEATEILMADVASLYMYYQEGTVVTKSNVKGVERFISEIYYIDERLKIE